MRNEYNERFCQTRLKGFTGFSWMNPYPFLFHVPLNANETAFEIFGRLYSAGLRAGPIDDV